MTSSATPLQQGLQHHRAGQLAEAERCYRQALAAEPDNADAPHLLGVIALLQGRPDEAVDWLQQAVARNPSAAEFHEHLGAAYQASGRTSDAVASCQQAVHLAPQSAGAHNELGNALRELGDAPGAEAAYRHAIELDPRLAVAHNNLGNVLMDLQRFAEATAAFQQAARLQPQSAEIHFNLGNCYRAQGDFPQALAFFRQASALRPEMAEAHHLAGVLLQAEQRYTEAADCHRQAVRWQPECIEAHNALGVSLQRVNRFEEAQACYRQALALDPYHVAATYNLATALHLEGHYEAAEALYQTAVDRLEDSRLQESPPRDVSLPDVRRVRADLRLCRDLIHLAEGRFSQGWPGFESRLQRTASALPAHPQPAWDGSDLENRTLLVRADWGLGDVMQFVRYLPPLRRRAPAARVLLEVDARLIPLLTGSGFDDLVPLGAAPSPFDVQVSLMSLPRLFATTLQTVPADIPYLRVDHQRVRRWQLALADIEGVRIGVHWQGDPRYVPDWNRSMPLACFEPLAQVPLVRLISLQKGSGSEQVRQLAGKFAVSEFPDLDIDGPFFGTAAVIQNVDLVITSDSAVAHLAGALGAPVWLALSAAPEWRWLRRRTDSPWYPTMRLFRQPSLGDWPSVFEQMREALAEFVRSRG